MGLEQIVPAIFLIAVLILVLPAFLRTNSKLKQFLSSWLVGLSWGGAHLSAGVK